MYTRLACGLTFALLLAACSGGDPGTAPTSTPSTVIITASAQSVVVGSSVQLSASARDQNGNVIAATVAWRSSAPGIASVSTSGLVTGHSAGTATITATATAGGSSASFSTQITVAPPAVLLLTSIGVGGAPASLVVGATAQLIASPRDQNSNAIAATVTWSTSSSATAQVSTGGLVTANAPGNVTITATAVSGSVTVTGSVQITVTPPPPVLTSVTITPPGASLTVGGTSQLAASPRDQNGNAIAATVTWATSDGTKVGVSPTGFVNAVAIGSATITATATAGGVTVNASVQVTVSAVQLVLTSVTIIAPATTVEAGSSVLLAATPKDQNGNAIAATVTWSSSAPTIASVNANGNVLGESVGVATITASATAGGVTVTANVQITVMAPPQLSSVFVTPGGASVITGQTVQLTAVALDQYGGVFASAVITWGTSNMAVATVNASGVVSGASVGSATITATATSGMTMVTNSVVVNVTLPPVLTSVVVTPMAPSVTIGGTVQLMASPRDQFGNPIAATVTWGSSDMTKATVSATGLVSGVAVGTSSITATATSGAVIVMNSVTVTVTAIPMTANVDAGNGTVFSPVTVDIAAGGSVTWTFSGLTHNVTFDAPKPPGTPADIGNTVNAMISRTFTTAGTFSYNCSLHAGMVGTVIVH